MPLTRVAARSPDRSLSRSGRVSGVLWSRESKEGTVESLSQAPMVFGFEGREIQVVMLGGDPWWVAKEVCEILGLDQVSRAVDRLEDDEHGLLEIPHPQNPDKTMQVNGVNEPGLYSLVIASRKPEAKAFKRWITHEVLPSIRKTGAYVAPTALVTPPTQGQLLVAMAQAYEAHERRILELASAQVTTQNQVQEIAARVDGITARQQEAADELTALPTPEGAVAGLSWRAKLNRLVRSFCLENSYGHQSAWSRLYLEYRDRYHVDLKARAHGKKTALDVSEELGITEQLYNLAHKIFVVGE